MTSFETTQDTRTGPANVPFRVSASLDYLRTMILSCVQWIANLIGAIVILTSDIHDLKRKYFRFRDDSDAIFYEVTATFGFFIGIILFVGQILNYDLKKIPNDNRLLLLIFLGYDALFALLNLVAASVIIRYAEKDSAMAVSIFFGYVAFFAFVIDGFFRVIKIRYGIGGNGNESQPDDQEGPWTTQNFTQ